MPGKILAGAPDEIQHAAPIELPHSTWQPCMRGFCQWIRSLEREHLQYEKLANEIGFQTVEPALPRCEGLAYGPCTGGQN
jgi:hypothetical protein